MLQRVGLVQLALGLGKIEQEIAIDGAKGGGDDDRPLLDPAGLGGGGRGEEEEREEGSEE